MVADEIINLAAFDIRAAVIAATEASVSLARPGLG